MDLRGIPPEILALCAVVASALAVAQFASSAWRDASRRRRTHVRAARATRGEERAAELLVSAGFEILGAQVSVAYPVHVDGEAVEISLRADYLVSRGESRWVVEVKTGSLAPRIDTAATRRQLLEYRIAFDVDGVLLADVEAGRIHSVAFPGLACAEIPRSRSRWFVWALVVLGVVVVLGRMLLAP